MIEGPAALEPGPVVEERKRFEVIDGRVVEKQNTGTFQSEFAPILAARLQPHAWQNNCGRFIVEALVRIDEKT